jgi:hypothetical protein
MDRHVFYETQGRFMLVFFKTSLPAGDENVEW